MKTTLARAIVSTMDAALTCKETGKTDWYNKHKQILMKLEKMLPSGSGINNGTFISDNSTPDKLVLHTDYHHMNENGYYDGWTSHKITIKASLLFGLNISISGRNRNDIKEYLHEVYKSALEELVVL